MSKYSELTKLGWYLGIFAVAFELSIGCLYLLPSEDRTFAMLTILEGGFALSGVLLYDVIHGKRFQLKPEFFKRPDDNTLKHTAYILGSLFLLQIVMQLPLTVRTWARALSIMFAGPSEELFFRGLLITPFIILGKHSDKLKLKNPFRKKGFLLEISPIEIMGILISSIAFMMLHINYYEYIQFMLIAFLSGVILGLFYVKYKNLTANILAHFLLNFIIVIQSFWMINF